MSRRLFIFTLAALAARPLVAADKAGEASPWALLQSGGYVVFMRHAVTDPGIGDPPNFRLGACGTQRNLSALGRADAARIGQAFRDRRIALQEVLSSRWCRCLDTAQLAFGRATPAPMLDSVFNQRDGADEDKARAVLARAASHRGPGNLVLVTHAQNISLLTGVSPASGEMVITTLEAPDRFKVVGRLQVPGT